MTLLKRVLARDEKAWRELVRSTEARLRVVVAEAAESIHPLADDQIDDVLGDFWLMLLEDDLRRLRSFEGDDLASWLSMLASQVATNAARKLARGPRFESLDSVREIAVDPPADGYLRTTEAAAYLRFRSPSGIRTAVMRGELQPAGVGPRGTLLFRREDLDQFVRARNATRSGRLARSERSFDVSDALSGNHEDRREQISDPRAGERSTHRKTQGGATNKRVHVEGGSGVSGAMARRGKKGVRRREARANQVGSICALVDEYQAAQFETVDGKRVRKDPRQTRSSTVR